MRVCVCVCVRALARVYSPLEHFSEQSAYTAH